MKWIRWAFVVSIWSIFLAHPSEVVASEGVVLNERVNVRTRPSIASEVIHQFNTGAKVVVLDHIHLNDPQPNEPKEWYQIQMPEETTLWVSAQYIDLKTKAVKASRLNVRAGPGLNFSVVGRIERNTVVEQIRASAGWMAIKPLPGTVAYVAAEFVNKSSTANTGGIIEPSKPTVLESATPEVTSNEQIPAPIVDAHENEIAETNPSEPPTENLSPLTTTPAPAVLASIINDSESLFDKVDAPLTQSPPPSLPSALEPTISPTEMPTITVSEEVANQLKRIITRNGIVKRTRNIQAPTYHRLDDPRTGTTINYLYTGKLQVDLGTGSKALKPYEGRKVRVVGTEAVDARWPRIPVIEVEQLRVLE
ncbi:MAG: hypothetical protein M2R45_04974 [Verrucomicrobia subdivision 3 bacterium]|nr:hypothetical protein [Limisphaerales bacterium]MCS1414079.1 hypothetical protein [Limisphaerales bacterium]